MQPITNEAQHKAALARMEQIWDAPNDTPEGQEALLLIDLICAYEKHAFPMATSRPGDMILHRLHDLEMRFEELAKHLGVSPKLLQDLVHHRRPFCDAWVAKLVEVLGVPEHIFEGYRVQAKGKHAA